MPSRDEIRYALVKLRHGSAALAPELRDIPDPYIDEAMSLIDEQIAEASQLTPFEVQDYKRLKALEAKGIEEYRKMREAPTLTPEAVVSFINQLSPWNLATTGVAVLKAYVAQLSPKPIEREQHE